MKTCSKCGYQNTDVAKTCANCFVDLHWAKVNLGKFTGTPDDTKRIGEEERKLHSAVITNDGNKPDLPRDFVMGCFGWIFVWNLVFVALFYGTDYGWDHIPWITGIFVAIGLVLPFIFKRNWLGYGILTCIIINAIIWIALTKTDFDISYLAIPLPLVLFFYQ